MAGVILIADSGSSKCEWAVVNDKKKKKITTQGLSPYFLSKDAIIQILQDELLSKLKNVEVENIIFYGTGLSNINNVKIIRSSLKKVFPDAHYIEVQNDLLAAARASCIDQKGIACILGTGSNSCYYNGNKIIKNSPGLGYVLGDEGSGAYLGKKVLQYYLYNTFDQDLAARFASRFEIHQPIDILENVYKKPLPNKYLASFAIFLAENRGHYMIENILEDGLNDFFFHHICKYSESWKHPINFTGSIAHGFKDILRDLCDSYEFELGNVLKAPMEGLIKYHTRS